MPSNHRKVAKYQTTTYRDSADSGDSGFPLSPQKYEKPYLLAHKWYYDMVWYWAKTWFCGDRGKPLSPLSPRSRRRRRGTICDRFNPTEEGPCGIKSLVKCKVK